MLDNAELPVAQPRDSIPLPASLNHMEAKKPGFLSRGGVGWDILGSIFDGVAEAGGGRGHYWERKLQHQQQTRADAQFALQQERENRIARRPVFQSVPNVGVVAIDPDTQESRTVVPFRSAARSYVEDDLGLTPDHPDYITSLADYALRANGPSALASRADLQDDRQEASLELVRERLGQQRSLVELRERLQRSRPSRARTSGGGGGGPPRNTNAVVAPLLAKLARGERLTPGEQAALDYNRRSPGTRVRPGGGPPVAPGTRESPVTLTRPQDVQYLQSGTYFRDPSGNVRRKP